MRATVFHGPGDVRVEDVPDPRIEAPTDALVRVVHACVCGSDLWSYRGVSEKDPGTRTGHEFLGIVEDVGSDVHSVRRGDMVISPFTFSDGDCEFCHRGLQTSCVNGGFFSGDTDGGQGEAVRVPYADGTLVPVPSEAAGNDALLTKLTPLTDVFPTGHHSVVSSGVQRGGTAVVIGDGAVGLCATLAAHRIGAERIVVVGHHDDRLDIARRFGATDVVTVRGEDAVAEILELTGGGAPSVCECVGLPLSFDLALRVARDGGTVGYVGVPQDAALDLSEMFGRNLTVRGGVAPARAYIPELMADILAGTVDPSPVLDLTVSLDDVPQAFAAMADRRVIKALVKTAG
ncbi:MAG: zinc-dependent alcohol dehydrogenase family protein [Actinomycetes bacterium]